MIRCPSSNKLSKTPGTMDDGSHESKCQTCCKRNQVRLVLWIYSNQSRVFATSFESIHKISHQKPWYQTLTAKFKYQTAKFKFQCQSGFCPPRVCLQSGLVMSVLMRVSHAASTSTAERGPSSTGANPGETRKICCDGLKGLGSKEEQWGGIHQSVVQLVTSNGPFGLQIYKGEKNSN
ncbi:hypothetical protein DUI87_16965 [Hirundo rustica rustica]|uniref:Uncharacterized protein n=1 Tax=Hirundo rustica rustica TaxID=333673 RepID=A0A3M0K4T3_HIRRU|nr:hypothetical protein DUI87_16965 [Hirundo rustica rustica]